MSAHYSLLHIIQYMQSHIDAGLHLLTTELAHTHTHSRMPSAKPLIVSMPIFTLHVYPDGSIQLIKQLPDLDHKLTLTDSAPVKGHAHFSACVQTCRTLVWRVSVCLRSCFGANLNKNVRNRSNCAWSSYPHEFLLYNLASVVTFCGCVCMCAYICIWLSAFLAAFVVYGHTHVLHYVRVPASCTYLKLSECVSVLACVCQEHCYNSL